MLAPVRFSNLKRIAISPAHYRWALDNPPEPTAAMRKGTCAHAALLGEVDPLCVYGGDRRGAKWAEFKAANEGREIYTVEEWETGREIADAVHSNEHAAALLRFCTLREQTIVFSIGKRRCAGRVDAFAPDFRALIEFKTTTDASPRGFTRQAVRMGYLAQVAWYMDGLELARGQHDAAYIIAAEVKPPHVVQVYEITPASLDFGRAQYRSWWERLMVCEESDSWPGYCASIVPLEPPVELGDVTLSIGDEEVSL